MTDLNIFALIVQLEDLGLEPMDALAVVAFLTSQDIDRLSDVRELGIKKDWLETVDAAPPVFFVSCEKPVRPSRLW